MAQSHGVSRRTALKIGAGAAALPLVHIRTAGAAGKLKVAFTTNFTPGADAACATRSTSGLRRPD